MNKFYPVAGMVALSAVTTACQQADKQEKKQYNIVYIMTDDHTAQMMSCLQPSRKCWLKINPFI